MIEPVLIIILLLLALCFLALSWFAGSDAPFVPSKIKTLKKLLDMAGVKKGQIFYELGSGDGRVVLEAAKLGADSFGIEQSWLRVWYSRYKAKALNLKNANFYHGDIFHRHYFPADVVYIFLLPKGVEKLEPKLKKELKKGSTVITQTFHFPNWKPYKKIDLSKEFGEIKFIGKNKKMGEFWLYKV